MTSYPVIPYGDYTIVVNPLMIGDRFYATFSIHKGDASATPNSVLQLPVVFQVGHREAPSFEDPADAIEDATESAKLWVDSQ